MAEQDFRNDHTEEITRKEHTRKNVGAKRVVLHGYDANTDTYYPITAIDNGDGTYSIKTSGSAADGHVVLAGTEVNQKDDANYGDGLTSGVATVHSRVWNGTNYDRDWGQARTKAYAYQAKSDDGTYKYFFFEDASKNYFIMRKNKTTGQAHYAAGTGGYESAYINSTSAPSGPPTWASYGTTF